MISRHVRTALLPVVAGGLLLSGCGSATGAGDDPAAGGDAGSATQSPDAERLSVLASFYPLQYVVEQVGRDAVDVTNLTPPGVESHDLELAPRDVGQLGSADLVVYLSGFQPAVDDAVASEAAEHSLDVADAARLDLTYTSVAAAVGDAAAAADGHSHDDDHAGDGHSHDDDAEHSHDDDAAADDSHDHGADDGHSHSHDEGAADPHFWLDPMRLADVADVVAQRLGEADPDRAEQFAAGARGLREELTALDAEIATGLASCQNVELVTSHTAFGYLADRYDLVQVGISGLAPESEPRPADLAAVTAYVREHDVRTIYYGTLVSPAVAETVANETGAQTAVLDPLEGLTDQSAGADYPEIMRANLAALRSGQDCP